MTRLFSEEPDNLLKTKETPSGSAIIFGKA